MEFWQLAVAGVAALAAGFINAVAGGGTLITFPVLVALGVNPVAANISNTIALCPGFLGGTYAQRNDIIAIKKTLFRLLPFSIAGGLAGGLLLLNTPETSFKTLIPYLILLASILLALQSWLRKKLQAKNETLRKNNLKSLATYMLVFLASAYGGYFGAGLGVILMAIFGLFLNDELKRLNALKQAIALSVNLTAACYFSFSGKAEWPFVIVMAAGAMCGGTIGGNLAKSLKPGIFRYIIVIIGVIVSAFYFFK